MELYKVLVSRSYHQDLQAILRYLAHDLLSPKAAEDFLDLIEETVQGLSSMPYRFELVKDERLRQQGYRKCLVKNYLLFYKVFEQEKIVRVYRVTYARRHWESLL
ncbi:MAG: type II toxin-antitoxin system RelE/ParE family toxin [Saccharofermentanales bacterium]|jgi:toxin ParE1/3/4